MVSFSACHRVSRFPFSWPRSSMGCPVPFMTSGEVPTESGTRTLCSEAQVSSETLSPSRVLAEEHRPSGSSSTLGLGQWAGPSGSACRGSETPTEAEKQLRRAGLGKGVWVLPRVSLLFGPSSPIFKGQRDWKRKEKRTLYTGQVDWLG